MRILVAFVPAKQQVPHVRLSTGRYIDHTHQPRSTSSYCGGKLTFSDFTGRTETGDAAGGPTEG